MTGYGVPRFFTDVEYRSCLDRGENVLPLPIGHGSMLWQSLSDFRFSMAGGNVGPYIPPSFLTPSERREIVGGLHLGPEYTAAMKSLIEDKQVTSVVVDAFQAPYFSPALDGLATPQSKGGVVLYQFQGAPPSCLGGP